MPLEQMHDHSYAMELTAASRQRHCERCGRTLRWARRALRVCHPCGRAASVSLPPTSFVQAATTAFRKTTRQARSRLHRTPGLIPTSPHPANAAASSQPQRHKNKAPLLLLLIQGDIRGLCPPLFSPRVAPRALLLSHSNLRADEGTQFCE
jgi:hypothetical protein